MKKLVIIGVGGFGREVAWLVERINEVNPAWDLLGFLDDNKKLHGNIVGGYPVLGGCDWLNEYRDDTYAVCSIGSSKIRRKIIERLDWAKFATIVDPSVIMSDKIVLGDGSIICAGTIATVDIEIGSHVIVNIDCTIGHDVVIKDYVTLYPSVNISGNTVLGECVEMGTGSQIIHGLKVGNRSIVGAGAVVVKDIPANCTAMGVPAKPILYSENTIDVDNSSIEEEYTL